MAALLLVGFVGAPRLSAAPFMDYKIGDIAKEDIISPLQLVVIDPEETALLRKQEAARAPVFYRYYTNSPAEVEDAFREVFAQTRSNFLNRVQAAFKRRQLDQATTSSTRFRQMAGAFQKFNRLFPVSGSLAELWAEGASDATLQSSLAAMLRQAMEKPVRPGNIPPEARLGPVRLVPMSGAEDSLTLEEAERRGIAYPRTNLVALKQARDSLARAFPADEQDVAKFLGSLLQVSCVPDLALIRQAMAKRTESLYAADRYEAGQVIVKQGQVIDRKARAALDQLREKAAIGRLQNELAQTQEQAQKKTAWALRLVMVLAAVVVVLCGLVVWAARRRRKPNLLPARLEDGAPAGILECPACAENIVVAAGPGDAAQTRLRRQMGPHLARWLMDKFVRRLLHDRSRLAETQEAAAAEMAEFDARLEKLQAPIQERLRAYEQRIAELEAQLARQGEENRELIKAKIAMVRDHLTATKSQLELN
jgi:membrane-associated HD superfamily phosphohydrolase